MECNKVDHMIATKWGRDTFLTFTKLLCITPNPKLWTPEFITPIQSPNIHLSLIISFHMYPLLIFLIIYVYICSRICTYYYYEHMGQFGSPFENCYMMMILICSLGISIFIVHSFSILRILSFKLFY